MYQFSVDSKIVGYAITPNYIKKLDNGYYGLCPVEEATGVVVDNTPYRLDGRELDNLPVASVTEITDSEFFSYVMQSTAALNLLGIETEVANNDA